jgi:peroxiredoxin family protein
VPCSGTNYPAASSYSSNWADTLTDTKEETVSRSDPTKPKRLAMIASKGTLDWAYVPFILANAGAAMGWEVGVFFTFFGLTLLKKDLKAKISPLGNPAMPMKMPFGPQGFQAINWPIPTALMSFPGFTDMTTGLMEMTFKNKGVATINEMRDTCVGFGVRMFACQMTADVFGFSKDDFIPEAESAGAAAFLEYASEADVSLFI